MKTFVSIILLIIIAGGFWYFASRDEGVDQTNSEMLEQTEKLAVLSETVAYSGEIEGLYAYPEVAGEYPGVIMIHEWWGLNDNIKEMATQLASEGYRVLAVDLYQGAVATTSERARELRTTVGETGTTQNLRDAAQFLRQAGANRLASLGWCYGGGKSLELALSGEPLDATVIYYGQLSTSTEELAAITWPVLGIFGETDTSIPVMAVNEFEQALNELSIVNEINIYPGVGHAFANPSGDNYAPTETLDAWEKTLTFLKNNLK